MMSNFYNVTWSGATLEIQVETWLSNIRGGETISKGLLSIIRNVHLLRKFESKWWKDKHKSRFRFIDMYRFNRTQDTDNKPKKNSTEGSACIWVEENPWLRRQVFDSNRLRFAHQYSHVKLQLIRRLTINKLMAKYGIDLFSCTYVSRLSRVWISWKVRQKLSIRKWTVLDLNKCSTRIVSCLLKNE